jgi:membrane protein required for colicin V production
MTILIDVLLVVCFLLTLIAGARGGFFRELFALLGVAGGVVAGLHATGLILHHLPGFLRNSTVGWVIAFVGVFLVTYLLANLIGMAFAALWEGKKPSGPSRALGLILGAGRGLILILFLAGTVVLLSPLGSHRLGRSRVLPWLTPEVRLAAKVLPPAARERLLYRWSRLPFTGDPGERSTQPDRSSPASGPLTPA